MEIITAAEARNKLNMSEDRLSALNKAKEWTMNSIHNAIKSGANRCCFAYNSAYGKDHTIRYDLESEMKSWLKSLGYHFEPTGYSGGVWQQSEDICW